MTEVIGLKTILEEARASSALIETHISWVLLGKRYVYKLKKPVDLGFLDFSTLSARHSACSAELSKNLRLAPTVYIDVIPVRRGAQGVYFADPEADWGRPQLLSENDEIVDWAVKMRRLSDELRADHLAQIGVLDENNIVSLAEHLASFHSRCETNERIQSFGQPAFVAENVQENLAQTRKYVGTYVDVETIEQIERQQLNFIEEHRESFVSRAAAARVRDGHGDLRLEHVYFEPSGISIIDCIEFNDRFRFADVCSDVAFLVMDLRHSRRSDWAELLLARYCQASGDFDIYRFIDFYESYRAFVRAKVTALLDEQIGHLPMNYALHHDLVNRARSFFNHALAAQKPQLQPPRIVAIGGLIASGKSTLANQLTLQACCPSISSDLIRKRLAGIEPLTSDFSSPFSGIYEETMSAQVYSDLFEHAKVVLQAGRSVVLDASFSKKKQRESLVSFARGMTVPLTFIWCQVSDDVTQARLKERASKPSISDGRAEIYDAFLGESDPFQSEEIPASLVLDTTLPEKEQLERLARLEAFETCS